MTWRELATQILLRCDDLKGPATVEIWDRPNNAPTARGEVEFYSQPPRMELRFRDLYAVPPTPPRVPIDDDLPTEAAE